MLNNTGIAHALPTLSEPTLTTNGMNNVKSVGSFVFPMLLQSVLGVTYISILNLLDIVHIFGIIWEYKGVDYRPVLDSAAI